MTKLQPFVVSSASAVSHLTVEFWQKTREQLRYRMENLRLYCHCRFVFVIGLKFGLASPRES